MKKLTEKTVSEFPDTDFMCDCGYRHQITIDNIDIGSGVWKHVTDIARPFSKGRIFLICDHNTYSILGSQVEECLLGESFNVDKVVFKTEHDLVPSEYALGKSLALVDEDTSLIVAVGSGVINDISRVLATKMHIPYVIIGTAPSMDGYASNGSPLLIDGFKQTYYGVYPYAIIGDVDILKEAPMEMLRAGFGDVLGKMTSLCDWRLSKILNDEHYCDVCATLMENAMNKCIENVKGIKMRDEAAIKYVMEALVIAGVAMGIYISTRPASSTEHYFAHYWDMDAISKGEEHPLHGNSVGAATYVTCIAYDMLGELLPEGFEPPDTKLVKALLDEMGAASNPKDIGISKELFYDSVLNCFEGRPKYTILEFAKQNGRLDEIAKSLTEYFYGI